MLVVVLPCTWVRSGTVFNIRLYISYFTYHISEYYIILIDDFKIVSHFFDFVFYFQGFSMVLVFMIDLDLK